MWLTFSVLSIVTNVDLMILSLEKVTRKDLLILSQGFKEQEQKTFVPSFDFTR